MDDRKKCTIRDIARESGVSIATVSRFLNKSGYVDAETSKKIQHIIDRHGYKPSRTAQSLKTRKSGQLMLIVPDISNPFYSTLAKTVQGVAKEKGYILALYNTNEDIAEEIKAIRFSGEIFAEGVILSSVHVRNEIIAELQKLQLPVVVANSYESCPFDSVHGVRGEGTYLAAKYLIELGHRRIAFAGGSKDTVIGASRRLGYIRAMNEFGIEYNEDYCFEMGFSEEAGYKAGKYFTALSSMPTAVCCANDLIALGVLAAFNEHNIKVPDDISVTGMDNIVFTNISRPRLTTVTNDSVEFGNRAANLLFERIEGSYSGAPKEILIPRRLVIRDSTLKIPSETDNRWN